MVNIKIKVKNLIKKHETRAPEKLAKILGITVVKKDYSSEKNKGYFTNAANEFAAELLIDDELLKSFEGYSLNQVSKSTRIDIKYLELKFKR